MVVAVLESHTRALKMKLEHDHFKELARAVAPLLRGEWRFDNRSQEHCNYVRHRDAYIFNANKPRMRFWLGTPGEYCHRKKGAAAGDYSVFDRALINSHARARIMYSPHRTAKSIAGDINRRFLPDFIKEWEQAEQQEAKGREQIEAFELIEQMLKRIVPGMRKSWERRSRTTGHYYTELNGLVFTLYQQNISIEQCNLSIDQFVRLIDFLKKTPPADLEQ